MSEPAEIIAGVDIGGSHIGIGLYNHQNHEELSLSEKSIQPSISPEEVVELVVSTIKNAQREIQYKTSLISIGIGFPGQSKNGILVAASNFPTWKMVPLAEMISERLDHIPATLMNDADAAIAAEVWGTDKYTNVRNASMISKSRSLTLPHNTSLPCTALGTGVGFGLILDGRLYSGANGLIEGGHMVREESFVFSQIFVRL
jgi:glucokinase